MDPIAEGRFKDFVAANSARMIRIAFLIAGNQSAAEDLLQDTLVRLYKVWPSLRGDEPPLNYVRRIIYTTHVSAWRRISREVLSAAPPDRADPDDRYALLATRDELWREVQQLPSMQRAVVLLRYYEDLDTATIARTLDISTGSVKTHASRALQKLREKSDSAVRREAKELQG
ncbi:MAG: SigE family RNA polymerase sigma factor [Actinomycetota bacterium]|nr:SigE family RNA polymerase sigma factor [Actinomycetota bacterium]